MLSTKELKRIACNCILRRLYENDRKQAKGVLLMSERREGESVTQFTLRNIRNEIIQECVAEIEKFVYQTGSMTQERDWAYKLCPRIARHINSLKDED